MDKVQEKHMSQSFIYGCEKGEIRQKKIDKNIVLCQRHYGESRVTACNYLRSDWRGRKVEYDWRWNYSGSLQ
jgi:hypothetical protein